MRDVVVISGRTGAGKSDLANALSKRFGFKTLKTRDVLAGMAAARSLEIDRLSLQDLGDTVDCESKFNWLRQQIENVEDELGPNTPIVVDNVRNWQQLKAIRSNLKWRVLHVHLYASNSALENRFKSKLALRPDEVAETRNDADLIKSEVDIDKFKDDADVRIWTDRIDVSCALVRVAARLGLYASSDIRNVDVIIGGQFGSEGKGQVAAHLSREYDILMRVGGPNAGHTVSAPSGVYTYHHLPSGCRDTDADILLAAGMSIRTDDLLKEIAECGIDDGRIFIDPNAVLIESRDELAEEGIRKSIASTARGGGAAAARRLMREAGNVRLVRDEPKLARFCRPTLDRLETAYLKGERILLEGTQGSGLSLFHGEYPYVTSRDTNVAGCLSEAGISPTRVSRVIMVIRSYPIRVGNPDGEGKTSGRLKYETTLDEIARRSGIEIEHLSEDEKTSTTRRDRRIGRFEWDSFRRSCALNAPTDIALTFADYLHPKNGTARRFEQLDIDTIKFIEEIEAVAHATVSLINNRFPRRGERDDLRTMIDRRHWTKRK